MRAILPTAIALLAISSAAIGLGIAHHAHDQLPQNTGTKLQSASVSQPQFTGD